MLCHSGNVNNGMSTNNVILLFYITAEAATEGVLDFQPRPQSNLKKAYKFITAHVFLNLFLKICFGQILITCVKCSRASFLPLPLTAKRCAGDEIA